MTVRDARTSPSGAGSAQPPAAAKSRAVMDRIKAANASESFRVTFLALSFSICCLVYYLGEVLDAVRPYPGDGFLYNVHDVQRLLFLVPVLYAGYFYGVRWAMFVTFAAVLVFLPRAFWISEYPHALPRVLLFGVVMGVVAVLMAKVKQESDRRDRLEARVRLDHDRLQRMLELMQEGVMLMGPDHIIRFVNETMERDFGPGKGRHCYSYVNGLDEPCGHMCKVESVLKGSIEKWEYDLPDGRSYEVIGSPFIDTDGVTCMLAVFRHISQRKKVEEELKAISRLKSELISNVSHELRSPLTSIKGIISSLLQKDVSFDEGTREMLLTGISEETDRLASLVTNLLNMSKIQAGVWKPDMANRNVVDLIQETLAQIKWVQKRRQFEVHMEPGLPDSHFDYNQMKQVIINLIENAAAYSDEGSTITVRASTSDGIVQVSVSDQGVGIPPEDLQFLFEKFHRGSQERRRPGGTGLGLAICKALIEAHGGRIWIESKLGEGSTFYFTLPPAVPDEFDEL